MVYSITMRFLCGRNGAVKRFLFRIWDKFFQNHPGYIKADAECEAMCDMLSDGSYYI